MNKNLALADVILENNIIHVGSRMMKNPELYCMAVWISHVHFSFF